MILKATAIAPSNIAFTKYWGFRDGKLYLPNNNTISMNLSACKTKTTVEFSPEFKEDFLKINGEFASEKETKRASAHLDHIRKLAGISLRAKVYSENSFPKGAGIASSASAHAALAVAGAKAAGLNLNERELSCLARLGSGSASRSVPDGFSEWVAADMHENSFAHSLAPPEHWKILDITAIVSEGEKKVGSVDGHRLAATSPLYSARLAHMKEHNDKVRKALLEKDFDLMGKIIEKDSLSLHAVMITSEPSIRYWNSASLKLMNAIESWRAQGIKAYHTFDAGPNPHIITLPEFREEILSRLREIPEVKSIIVNEPCEGARLCDEHLF